MAAATPTLTQAARDYWGSGLNVLPVYRKRPLVEWKQWQDRRQTKEEFGKLLFDRGDGIAIMCGTPKYDGGGPYFLCIDVDTHDFNLSILPITACEKTPHGYHYYYLSQINADGEKHTAQHLELLGRGNIVVVWPTAGYTKVNDNSPREVFALHSRFQNIVRRLGGGKTRRTIVQGDPPKLPAANRVITEKDASEAADFLAKYWLPGYRNRICMCYCGLCLKKGYSYEAAKRVIELVTDRTGDPEKQERLELVLYHYVTRANKKRLLGARGLAEIFREIQQK